MEVLIEKFICFPLRCDQNIRTCFGYQSSVQYSIKKNINNVIIENVFFVMQVRIDFGLIEVNGHHFAMLFNQSAANPDNICRLFFRGMKRRCSYCMLSSKAAVYFANELFDYALVFHK